MKKLLLYLIIYDVKKISLRNYTKKKPHLMLMIKEEIRKIHEKCPRFTFINKNPTLISTPNPTSLSTTHNFTLT